MDVFALIFSICAVLTIQIALGFVSFFTISLGGIAIGILWGMLASFLTRFTDHVRGMVLLAITRIFHVFLWQCLLDKNVYVGVSCSRAFILSLARLSTFSLSTSGGTDFFLGGVKMYQHVHTMKEMFMLTFLIHFSHVCVCIPLLIPMAVLETLCVFICGYLGYLSAEIFHFSGILR